MSEAQNRFKGAKGPQQSSVNSLRPQNRLAALDNSRSRKALGSEHAMNSVHGGSPEKHSQKEAELAHESQLFNLDNEGTSQFTYPASLAGGSPKKKLNNQTSLEYNPVSFPIFTD